MTDAEDAEVVATTPDLPPEAMTGVQLGDCLEELAHHIRQHLEPEEMEALMVAAARVRQLHRMRDALIDRIESTLRLEQQIQQERTTEDQP